MDLSPELLEQLVKVAVLETNVSNLQENIARQAHEYERRLTELNHAHAQQVARNAEYVSREAWEMRNIELDAWRRAIDQWRWISIGAGIAGGGLTALLARLLGG